MIKRQETPTNDFFAASRSRRCYLENYRCKAPIWAGWAPPVMNKRRSRARIWSELHTYQLATHARDTQTDGGTMNERSCSKRISKRIKSQSQRSFRRQIVAHYAKDAASWIENPGQRSSHKISLVHGKAFQRRESNMKEDLILVWVAVSLSRHFLTGLQKR